MHYENVSILVSCLFTTQLCSGSLVPIGCDLERSAHFVRHACCTLLIIIDCSILFILAVIYIVTYYIAGSMQKLHIIFDLDKTLIHSHVIHRSTNVWEEGVHPSTQNDISFEHTDDKGVRYKTYIRPCIHYLLNYAINIGIVYLYTNATKSYTKNIISVIDPVKRYFSKIKTRSDFRKHDKSKNYRNIIGNSICETDIILIDDKISSHCHNPLNGLLIKKFQYPIMMTSDGLLKFIIYNELLNVMDIK